MLFYKKVQRLCNKKFPALIQKNYDSIYISFEDWYIGYDSKILLEYAKFLEKISNLGPEIKNVRINLNGNKIFMLSYNRAIIRNLLENILTKN